MIYETLDDEKKILKAAERILKHPPVVARFYSHRTSKENAKSIMQNGLTPMNAPFAELKNSGNFSMFSGCYDTTNKKYIHTVGGNEEDVVLIFRFHPSIMNIYEAFYAAGTLNQRVIDLSAHIANWYISYEIIPPEFIVNTILARYLR